MKEEEEMQQIDRMKDTGTRAGEEVDRSHEQSAAPISV